MKTKDQEYEKVCALCEYGMPLCGKPERLLCKSEGVVPAAYHCGKFSFDPLKCRPGQKPALRDIEGMLAMEEEAAKPEGEIAP